MGMIPHPECSIGSVPMSRNSEAAKRPMSTAAERNTSSLSPDLLLCNLPSSGLRLSLVWDGLHPNESHLAVSAS